MSGYVAGMETFTPTLDWGNELWASLVWIAKGWAIAAIATLVILRPDRPFHRVGQAVLAYQRRIFHRCREPEGVAVAGGDPAPGHCRCATRGAAELPEQRHADQLPDRRSGQRSSERRRRRGEGLWQERFLPIPPCFLGPGRPVHRTAPAGHVPGAALLPGVARVAHRSAHRGLAGRQGLLPGPLHRRQDRQSRPAHPGRYRHLHRLQWTASQRSVLLLEEHAAVRRDRCRRLDDLVHGDPVEPVRHADNSRSSITSFREPCSGSESSSFSSRPSSRSGSAGRSSGCLQQREIQRRVPLRIGATA